MIDRDHKLSIKLQTKLLDISRGAVYCQPRPIRPCNQRLMNRIDRLHLELPFAGARMLRDLSGISHWHHQGSSEHVILNREVKLEFTRYCCEFGFPRVNCAFPAKIERVMIAEESH